MKIRRIICLLLLSVLVFLQACSYKPAAESSPLSVSGTPIDAEVFRYYLNLAIGNEGGGNADKIINDATQLCIRYVAVNTAFAYLGGTLTPAERSRVSQDANGLWQLFGSFYEAIGVSKETFVKLRMSEGYKEKIRLMYFDKDGITPIDEEVIKSYFRDNYVCFKLISGSMYRYDVYGKKVGFGLKEISDMLDKYDRAAENVNSGASMEVVYSSLVDASADVEQSLTASVVESYNTHYPEGFYEYSRGLKVGEASVNLFGDSLYLVLRTDIFAPGNSFYDNYRSECLKAVSEVPLRNVLDELCLKYKSVRTRNVADNLYTELLKARNSYE